MDAPQYLSTLPDEVNIDHYAGDTLSLHLTIDNTAAIVNGRSFIAQVRRTRTAKQHDAVFVVYPDPKGAYLTLLAKDCRRLTQHGDYSGYWDVQLDATNETAVTTLVQGELNLHMDVSRRSG
jgi:hypothetical protein